MLLIFIKEGNKKNAIPMEVLGSCVLGLTALQRLKDVALRQVEIYLGVPQLLTENILVGGHLLVPLDVSSRATSLLLRRVGWLNACDHVGEYAEPSTAERVFDCVNELREAVVQETELTAEQLVVATVGKLDAKKRIEESVIKLMSANIVHCLGTMLDTVVF